MEQFKDERYKDSIKFLVGNKADLSKDQRQVPTDTAIVSSSYSCYSFYILASFSGFQCCMQAVLKSWVIIIIWKAGMGLEKRVTSGITHQCRYSRGVDKFWGDFPQSFTPSCKLSRFISHVFFFVCFTGVCIYQHDMLFFETSCKDGTNVELAVMTMVAKIMEGKTKRKHKLKSEDSRSCCIA
jgi:hypothetical protein